MKKLSRRAFLKKSALGIGAFTLGQMLAGCAPQATPLPPTQMPPTTAPSQAPSATLPLQPTSTSAPLATDAPKPTVTITSAPTSTSNPPELVVARGADPEQLVRQALLAMGGIERFIKKGAKVVIKPNICVAYHTYEYAATTNPWVVAALVKLCKEAGAATVRVFDYPFGGTAKDAYIKSGIDAQVKAAGGEMVIMSDYKFVPTTIPRGKDLKNIMIYDEILKADAIINVPIAKHHNLARYTLSMKNLMGVIDDRIGIHRNVGQRLADLATVIKPTLNVVDAVRTLMNNGPTGGNLADVKKQDTIIVSPDIIAADAYASTLFGKQPYDLTYVVAGAAMGIGKMDLKAIRIQEIKVGG